ncbi:MAG: ribosomal protein S18-alanine N-acetyltransferase [Actinomycetota bacterium]|nr:ribosomal protein S18-alanine N-acetyltransferase [Actinomycetota bacterium]
MVVTDVHAVLSIDDEVYPQSWSPSFLREQLSYPQTRVNRVAELGDQVVGHAGLMVIADEGHVTTLAVHPKIQGSGVGTRLMADLFLAAVERRLASMTLEVRVSNQRARDLYRRFGFVPAGVRANYYSDTGEDALIMWVDDLTDRDFLARVEVAQTGHVRVEDLDDS